MSDTSSLRSATEADLDQICALLAERGDEADAEDLLLVVADEGLDAVAVVVDDTGRVISTASLLTETVSIDGVALPAGQVELVATAPGHEGRGHVRALMHWAHARSAARGDLVQVMVGIPNFYRQFGYSYSMPIPLPWEIDARSVTPPPGISVRDSTIEDIAAMEALQSAAQSVSRVRMSHSTMCSRWLVERSGSTQVVAERDGVIIGTGRSTPPDEGMIAAELAGDVDAVTAIVADAIGRAAGEPVEVLERPGTTVDSFLDAVGIAPGQRDRRQEWFYARVPDLASLLDHLAPALHERFVGAGLRGAHDVLLSTWRSHVRFSIDDAGMSPVRAGGPEQAPLSKGGSGVAPDQVAPLLFGPLGAAGLEARHADVMLGRQRDLMEVLFPPMSSDVLTFYLPV